MSKQMKEIHDLHIEGLSVAQEAARSETVIMSPTKPSAPVEGEMWFDSSTGHSYVSYSHDWIQVGGSAK